MLIKLENGSIYDPDLNCHGDIGNLFIEDGSIIADPDPDARFDTIYGLIRDHKSGNNTENHR